MKHLENFKSEYIQSIYDFLEQDADVTNFKRDLIAVAEYKKVDLQDLEAEVFQYHDLMKEDLKDKITFVFREDSYLGMFGEGDWFPVGNEGDWFPVETFDDYQNLKTGDRVSTLFGRNKDVVYGYIWCGSFERKDGWVFMIQNRKDGYEPDGKDWRKYGRSSISICSKDGIRDNDQRDVKVMGPKIPNLITNEKVIKELKSTMHFALVF